MADTTAPAIPSVEQCVARVLRGDCDAFEHLIRRYERDVLKVVRSLLFDRSATEDLVQQVFVNAYVHLDQYQSGRDFGKWIRTIARNAVREELRRRSRYANRLKTYGEILAGRISDEQGASLHEELLLEALRHCMGKLSGDAARIVQLRYAQGKSFDEIGKALGRSANAVRQVLCRVRVRLRQCIDTEMAK